MRTSRRGRACSALTCAAVLLGAAPAQAGPSAQAANVHVEVDAAALGDDASARLSPALAEAILARAAEKGYRSEAETEADLQVRAQVAFIDEDAMSYVVHLQVREGEGARAVDRECLACTETQVVDEALGGIDELLADGGGVEEELPPPPEPVVAPEPGRPRFGQLFGPVGISGLAAGGAGLVTLIAGGVQYGRGKEGDCTGRCRNYSQEGAALMSVASGFMVLGAAAMVVDALVLAPRRARQDTVTVSGSLSRHYGGVQIITRF